ncbi:hypothetical protein LZ31DRAFT_60342 [Colletotrichum somersetense]|nr:hypothetical protein LZ31DRAFT_60342 [Colletotrichum somersetense]
MPSFAWRERDETWQSCWTGLDRFGNTVTMSLDLSPQFGVAELDNLLGRGSYAGGDNQPVVSKLRVSGTRWEPPQFLSARREVVPPEFAFETAGRLSRIVFKTFSQRRSRITWFKNACHVVISREESKTKETGKGVPFLWASEQSAPTLALSMTEG